MKCEKAPDYRVLSCYGGEKKIMQKAALSKKYW